VVNTWYDITCVLSCELYNSKSQTQTTHRKWVITFYQTRISSGDDHLQTFGFLPLELSCLTPVTMQSEGFFNISGKNTKNTQKGGQNGHFGAFSDPWLA